MARNVRASNLEVRSARLKLAVARKPIFVKIGDGVALGYRRNATAGVWVARVADGKGGNWTKAVGTADDFEDADGGSILNFWQAQEKVRGLARGGKNNDGDNGKLITVKQAIDTYELDLKTRGANPDNAARIRVHLSDTLASKTVALLTARDLRQFRDGLVKAGLAPASMNRISHTFKAALNLAANVDERIVNMRAWNRGLATIPDAAEARNVILTEANVLRIIASAYKVEGEKFGLYTEVAGVTGSRPSQIARVAVQDVQADRPDPRMMMPTSRKGRGTKKISRHPLPIPADFAKRLKAAAAERGAHAPLLVKESGEPWRKSDHSRRFANAVKAAGLDPAEITIYALRHSNIVRQLLAGTPTRVVAVNHDTSVLMIEKNYSAFISDHSDTITRRALLDTSQPSADNIVALPLAKAG